MLPIMDTYTKFLNISDGGSSDNQKLLVEFDTFFLLTDPQYTIFHKPKKRADSKEINSKITACINKNKQFKPTNPIRQTMDFNIKKSVFVHAM